MNKNDYTARLSWVKRTKTTESSRHKQRYFIHSYRTEMYTLIHPIHVTAMMNKKRGLEGKFARQYVNRDVRSLLLHVPVT